MFRPVYIFFDKLEDKIRGKLSHWPIAYAFIGGIGIILFWRGVWHTTDSISAAIFGWQSEYSSIDYINMTDGLLSLVLGLVMLLMTGLFVSNFIGNEIIISGLRGEKRLAERTEQEVRYDTTNLTDIKKELREIKESIEKLKKS